MTITSAYKAGVRAGRAEPDIEIINGHSYLKTPKCPFKWFQFIRFFLWNEGYYNGVVYRLTSGRRCA